MGNVLFVDDDLARLAQVRQLLVGKFDVEPAFTAWDGVAAAMMYKPALVLFNLAAPVMTGPEALRLIRSEEASRELPVLGFTDPRDPELEEAALRSGCTRMLENLLDPALPQLLQSCLPAPEPDSGG